MLFASCSIFKKSVNTQKSDVSKYQLKIIDSIVSFSTGSTSTSRSTGWVASSTDSGYDKVTDEIIKDYGDSVFTVRTVKEKGQKRTEQLSRTSKYDSTSSMITEHSQLQEVEIEDSAATIVTTNKGIKRSTFLPWWIWLIAAVAIVFLAATDKSIIEFLKPKHKS